MSEESRESKVNEVLAALNARELRAYQAWCSGKEPPLAPVLNAKLFGLFLQGHGCEEIVRLNSPNLKLGQVVAARVEGRWDHRREEHLEQLLDSTTRRVEQVTMETADFVCDLLAVANREHGDRLRRYLQTGDEKELGSFKIDSLFGLKQAIEVLQRLTVQEASGRSMVAPAVAASLPEPSASEAASALKLILNNSKKE